MPDNALLTATGMEHLWTSFEDAALSDVELWRRLAQAKPNNLLLQAMLLHVDKRAELVKAAIAQWRADDYSWTKKNPFGGFRKVNKKLADLTKGDSKHQMACGPFFVTPDLACQNASEDPSQLLLLQLKQGTEQRTHFVWDKRSVAAEYKLHVYHAANALRYQKEQVRSGCAL